MKKALSLLLTLCLFCACCAAGAEETAALRFEQNGFTADIPEGWVYGYTEGTSTFYYAPVEGSADNAMLMIMMLRDEAYVGTEMTDEQLRACGISPGLVRMSCGLENGADLIADIAQALDR